MPPTTCATQGQISQWHHESVECALHIQDRIKQDGREAFPIALFTSGEQRIAFHRKVYEVLL